MMAGGASPPPKRWSFDAEATHARSTPWCLSTALITQARMMCAEYYYRKNTVKAIQWYYSFLDIERSNPYARAQCFLKIGKLYYYEQKEIHSFAHAFDCFQKAFCEDPDDCDILLHLAICYYKGLGTPVDYSKALECFKRLAANHSGSIKYTAMFYTGLCYYYGNGICFALDFCCNRNERYRKAKKGSRTERSCAWLYYV